MLDGGAEGISFDVCFECRGHRPEDVREWRRPSASASRASWKADSGDDDVSLLQNSCQFRTSALRDQDFPFSVEQIPASARDEFARRLIIIKPARLGFDLSRRKRSRSQPPRKRNSYL